MINSHDFMFRNIKRNSVWFHIKTSPHNNIINNNNIIIIKIIKAQQYYYNNNNKSSPHNIAIVLCCPAVLPRPGFGGRVVGAPFIGGVETQLEAQPRGHRCCETGGLRAPQLWRGNNY